ncbi:lysozyme [Novosphingobium aerophilum]|uniref:lysozyme n=1 Tax=Novosphingobium TaxID=165696 RepID=UPI0006C846EF|nr:MULTISPECIES: lysozyme [unclassified Novosphingobium]KPH64485.1 glycoside hydrolase [Novosphingobium sp. ST904]TCM31129.1 GH24 family phage-related lysozyme (muramidase) [Novosphingobium sp. ST904]WRT93571.1 lysozyme [Novosphingobium sp. RL4]
MLDRKPIFDEVRQLLGRGFTAADVIALDAAIDRGLGEEPPAAAVPTLGASGRALIHKWEGCARRRADGLFEAYPDPGSRDGKPWTIGWGSTGTDIGPGTVWTQAQCDARFESEIERYVRQVRTAIGGAATTPNQFNALVSFHYNTGAIAKATLTRLHREGRFAEAAAQFGKWIYNDGKVLEGLKRRREDEAKLYALA